MGQLVAQLAPEFDGEVVGIVDPVSPASTGTIDDPDFGHEEITPWMAEVGNDGHLRGSALITSRYANIFGPQVVQYREEMIDIVRQ